MFDVNEVVGELQGLREEGYLSDALLRRAVRSIFSSEERFDWVGIYLLRSEENVLWLHNYLGDPTPHATIPVGEGICGMAVANNENINVINNIINNQQQLINHIINNNNNDNNP